MRGPGHRSNVDDHVIPIALQGGELGFTLQFPPDQLSNGQCKPIAYRMMWIYFGFMDQWCGIALRLGQRCSEKPRVFREIMEHDEAVASERQQTYRFAGFRNVRKKLEERCSRV